MSVQIMTEPLSRQQTVYIEDSEGVCRTKLVQNLKTRRNNIHTTKWLSSIPAGFVALATKLPFSSIAIFLLHAFASLMSGFEFTART